LDQESRLDRGVRSRTRIVVLRTEPLVLDLVCIVGVIALFAIVALIARAVEKL